MAASRKSGGGNVALALANVKRRSGGGWVTATIAKRRSGGAWVDIFPAATVLIADRTILDQQDNPTTAVATYTLNNDGTNGFPSEWLTGGTPSDYEVQATQFSISLDTGGSTSGTLNSWLNLGTTRAWSVTQVAGAGSRSSQWVIDLTIRRVSDAVVMDTARITLQAETIAI